MTLVNNDFSACCRWVRLISAFLQMQGRYFGTGRNPKRAALFCQMNWALERLAALLCWSMGTIIIDVAPTTTDVLAAPPSRPTGEIS